MVLNTATVGMAVTPTVVTTLFSHYLNRKPLHQRPTAHLSYDQGLHLIKQFLIYVSHHTIEELQAFMAQWVPHPQWVRVEPVTIPADQLAHAAAVLEEQLGPEGRRRVGGSKWWQWRKPKSQVKAEWIEMRSEYHERIRAKAPCRRVMFYVHGGAYFFGSVDVHRYQMQRHARKLKARVFAPRYRLAPQFPFPCGLQDCLAAYLHLLTLQDPSTVVLAGDSAGAGMVLSMLVVIRDRGLPAPAGAVLISPWVDLTHSFPSVSGDCPLDYIPNYGFHHKPSMDWPPPTEDVLQQMHKLSADVQAKQGKGKAKNSGSGNGSASKSPPALTDEEKEAEAQAAKAMFESNRLSLVADGKELLVREQIQLYTTNAMLNHPLVSPVLQPTLGGLPPLLIMTGGGEILRDEQIYLAHKCANPAKYAPPLSTLDEAARAALKRYPPTDVQLQVWDDLCHVAPTLSFTRPAKFMYRSVAQFGAWALARAQKTEIDILDDDDISVISSSSSDAASVNDGPDGVPPVQAANGKPSESDSTTNGTKHFKQTTKTNGSASAAQQQVGKAGDSLPAFRSHMIRQRVTRHGDIFPLAREAELPGCNLAAEYVGVAKQVPVSRWTATKQQWDARYASARKRVLKRRLADAAVGFESFGPGEHPPPSALAGRRKIGADLTEVPDEKKKRNLGLAMWAGWGSKHDEQTMERQQEADNAVIDGDIAAVPEIKTSAADDDQGEGSRTFNDLRRQQQATAAQEANITAPPGIGSASASRSRSRHRFVRDENQTGSGPAAAGETAAVDENTPVADLVALGRAGQGGDAPASPSGILGPVDDPTKSNNSNKVDGSAAAAASKKETNGLLSPDAPPAAVGVTGKRPYVAGIAVPFSLNREADTASMVTLQSAEPPQTIATATPSGQSALSPAESTKQEAEKEKAEKAETAIEE